MPRIDFIVETELSESSRVQQLSAMFDVPPAKKSRLEWHGDLPIESDDWSIGLIVGPSGCGKSSIARQVFGERYEPSLSWEARSVIDDFTKTRGTEEIAAVCQAVGFNTIPAWMRPFSVLSNGEKFRVELARRLLECEDPIVIDEFTSVVDRQIAQIGAHAVQKYVRRNKRKFVGVSCHYDIIDWLQPDWIFEPATMHFARRSLQRRPTLDVTISRVPYSAWKLFAPFHYMSADLNPSARCFALFVSDRIASIAAVLNRPISRGENSLPIMGLSRLVTLPDWQGLGLAMILSERLAAMYASVGKRFRTYPAHPALVRSYQRAECYRQIKSAGNFSTRNTTSDSRMGQFGGRPCAVFEYIGPAMPRDEAERLLAA